jgi:hypothetical protein
MRDVEVVRALAKPLVVECIKKGVRLKTNTAVWIEVHHKRISDEIESELGRPITSEEDDVVRGLLEADHVKELLERNDSGQRSNNRSRREPSQPGCGELSVKHRTLGLSSWRRTKALLIR